MHTAATPWGWEYDIGFTVSFTRDAGVADILQLYGTGPERVELLTREDALTRCPPQPGGSQLRAGRLSDWAFCFEEFGVHGVRSDLLKALSAGTEVLSYSAGFDMKIFQYYRGGQRIESFERAMPSTLRGTEPHRFWEATRRAQGHPESAIAGYIGAPLTLDILEGPLSTIWVADGPAPRSTPPTTATHLGEPLGTLRPPTG
ncbi:DUF6461 domain-containing protein [Actinoplanes sp. CA-054009]